MSDRTEQIAVLTAGINAVKLLRTSTQEQAASGLKALEEAGWLVVRTPTIPERVSAIRDHYRGMAERVGTEGGGDRTLNDINYLLGQIAHLTGYIEEHGYPGLCGFTAEQMREHLVELHLRAPDDLRDSRPDELRRLHDKDHRSVGSGHLHPEDPDW